MRTLRLAFGWALFAMAPLGVGALALGAGGASAAYDPPGPEQAQRGGDLYARYCLECHGRGGRGTPRGPSLQGMGTAAVDFALRSGRMPIAQPDDEPRSGEPVFTEEQIRRLVDYLAEVAGEPAIPQLDLDDRNLARGGELYRLHCAACHNWGGQGGALVHHEIAPDLIERSPIEVAEAVRIGPGAMPRFGPDTIGDDELDDLVAYVAFLDELPDAGGFPLGHWGPALEGLAGAFGVAILLGIAWWAGAHR